MGAPGATSGRPSPAARGWRWTLLAAAVGFLASFVGSGLLQLPRSSFVAAYAIAAGVFFTAWASSHRIDIRTQVRRHWVAGAVVGLAVGLLLAAQVLGQPASERPAGMVLVVDLAWYGLAYGLVDALLLSVVPVLSLYGMQPASELRQPAARFRWAAVAVAGSALVTVAYHAGFEEFRGVQLVQPLVGNVLITLAYLLTGSPLGAVVSHVLMHLAAVLHGMATTVQLPPHY